MMTIPHIVLSRGVSLTENDAEVVDIGGQPVVKPPLVDRGARLESLRNCFKNSAPYNYSDSMSLIAGAPWLVPW